MRNLLHIACLLALALPTLAQRNILSDISTRARSQMVPGQRDLRLQPGAVAGSYKFFVLTSENATALKLDSADVIGVGKRFAMQQTAIATRTPFMAQADVQALTLSSSETPKAINLTNPYKGGLFILSPSETRPHDGAIVIRTASNQAYVRVTDGGAITPPMFGAIPNDGIDDSAALLAWINYTGAYWHQLPPGVFDCSVNLLREDKGAFTLTGAGSDKSIIRIRADVHGITIKNNPDTNLGLVQLQGFSVWTTVAMSAGKTAIYCATQHEQQPGVLVRDVAVDRKGGYEWPIGLNLHDCSAVTVDNYAYNGLGNGSGVFTSVGLLIDNTYFASPQGGGATGRPAVNYHLINFHMEAVGTGVRVDGRGLPAHEGIALYHGRIVSCNYGFRATSANYLATLIDLDDFHSEGYGPGIDIDGFTQVQTDKCLIYTNNPPSGVADAEYSVRINNPIAIRGNLQINAQAPVQTCVDLPGTGNSIMLEVLASPAWGESHAVRVSPNISLTNLNVNRLWTGAHGNNTGQKVYDYNAGNANYRGYPQENREVSVYATPDATGLLDLTAVRAPYVIIPASYTGVITYVNAQIGAQHTLQSEAPLTLKHSGSGGLWLHNQADLTLPAHGKITLRRTTQWVEEVAQVSNARLRPVLEINANLTLTPELLGYTIVISAPGLTVTVPKDKLPVGWHCRISNNHNITATTAVAGASGVSVNYNTGKQNVAGAFGAADLEMTSNNWVSLTGNVTN